MLSENSRPAFLDQPESRRLEFKETFPKGELIARTAVAFANGAGGRIIFGVKDTPREVTGISDDQLFHLKSVLPTAYLIFVSRTSCRKYTFSRFRTKPF